MLTLRLIIFLTSKYHFVIMASTNYAPLQQERIDSKKDLNSHFDFQYSKRSNTSTKFIFALLVLLATPLLLNGVGIYIDLNRHTAITQSFSSPYGKKSLSPCSFALSF